MEILPNVYLIKMVISNCYLIREGDELTLIDAGVSASYGKITAFIRLLGHNPTDLTRILLTHADLDHVGAAVALQADSGAKILASQIAADALAEGRSSRQVKMGFLTPLFNWFEQRSGAMRVVVDEIISAGQILPILDGLQVIETPGHTPGHVSFYALQPKLLFAGDSVTTQPGKVLYNRRAAFNWDEARMRESVHLQHTLQPEIVCSGHGPVVFGAVSKFPMD